MFLAACQNNADSKFGWHHQRLGVRFVCRTSGWAWYRLGPLYPLGESVTQKDGFPLVAQSCDMRVGPHPDRYKRASNCNAKPHFWRRGFGHQKLGRDSPGGHSQPSIWALPLRVTASDREAQPDVPWDTKPDRSSCSPIPIGILDSMVASPVR